MYLRQCLEATGLKGTFPTVYFYANLVAHFELDRKENLVPLQYFASMSKGEAISDLPPRGPIDIIGWPKLELELEKMAERKRWQSGSNFALVS